MPLSKGSVMDAEMKADAIACFSAALQRSAEYSLDHVSASVCISMFNLPLQKLSIYTKSPV